MVSDVNYIYCSHCFHNLSFLHGIQDTTITLLITINIKLKILKLFLKENHNHATYFQNKE